MIDQLLLSQGVVTAKEELGQFELDMKDKKAERKELAAAERSKLEESGGKLSQEEKDKLKQDLQGEKVDFDDKAEAVSNAASDAVAKIGASLLELISSKMILMMLLTLICHVLLEVPGLQGVQQQYGITVLYEHKDEIGKSMTQYRRGNPIGSHFDPHTELVYLRVAGTYYNDDLETSKVDDYHWENMQYFIPDGEGEWYSDKSTCDVEWHSIKEIKGSACWSYAVFSDSHRTRAQALNNIAFMFILLLIMIVGLALIALDFTKVCSSLSRVLSALRSHLLNV